jgi:nondiscriminating glutamyl-tRNA synthetase
MSVRTRFAPSPTGYLHIGGARTAFFNWLLARRHQGEFILRIDDTDEARHVEDAVGKILEGFAWLGLGWDEGPEFAEHGGGSRGPYYQSQRSSLYEAAIVDLIRRGHAYPDVTPPEETELARKAAEAAKQPFVYRGKDRDIAPADALVLYESQRPSVRFKVPTGQTTVFEDKVRGRVEWQTDLLGDFTIARTGGKPLYNLASVLDDIGMEITHIVRAEEHLSNTHPQLHLFEGLGAKPPVFAHIPYVAAPATKKKLSKRNPPPGVMVAIEEYQKAGYLPAAILNALGRLGWSLDDKTELMDVELMKANFSLERVIASPAGLDPDKMFWMQDHYMRQLTRDQRVDLMLPFLVDAKLIADPVPEEARRIVEHIDQACGDRLKLLADIVRYGSFCFAPTLEHDKEAAKNLRKEGVASALVQIRNAVAHAEPFDLVTLESAIQKVGSETGMGGKINNVVRAAVTGRTVGPGVFDCLVLLGKEKSLRHIDHSIQAFSVDAPTS